MEERIDLKIEDAGQVRHYLREGTTGPYTEQEIERLIARLERELKGKTTAYESSHASRLHAERCVERLERELEKAEAEVARLRDVVRECRNALARIANGRHPAQGECPVTAPALRAAEAALGEEGT